MLKCSGISVRVGKNKSTYISGHQLLSVIHVLHSGHALGAEVVVVRVGGHQQHV